MLAAVRVAKLVALVSALAACDHSSPTVTRPPQDSTPTVSVQFASNMPMLVAVGDSVDLRGLARYYTGTQGSDSVSWTPPAA
jgi:hypothetical protein